MLERLPQPDDIESRFDAALSDLDKETSKPNCRGSVLYWIGAREKEHFAWPADLQDILDRDCQITADPKDGDIAVWYAIDSDCSIPHAGIVVKTSGDLLIRSRIGAEEDSIVLELPPDEVLGRLKYKLATRLVYFKKK